MVTAGSGARPPCKTGIAFLKKPLYNGHKGNEVLPKAYGLEPLLKLMTSVILFRRKSSAFCV